MRVLLRFEHGALAALAVFAYWQAGAGWWLFLALILLPDLSIAAYLAGPKFGAMAYNAAHGWIGVVALTALAWVMAWPLGLHLALIWAAHIGIDRALGYGLKYETGFADTHLGRIGGAKPSRSS